MFLRFPHVERTAGKKKWIFVRTRKYRQYLVKYNGGFTVYKLNYMQGKDLYAEELTDHLVEVGEDNLLRLVYPSKLGFDRQTRLIHLFDVDAKNVLYRGPSSDSSSGVVSDSFTIWLFLGNVISLCLG
jgi:hypothetical protein